MKATGFPRLAAKAGSFELFLVSSPNLGTLVAQFFEIGPGEYSSGVAIAEFQADGIVSNRLGARDEDIALSEHQLLLAWTMAFNLGTWAFHPQKLGRQRNNTVWSKMNFKYAALIDNMKTGWPGARISHHQVPGPRRAA